MHSIFKYLLLVIVLAAIVFGFIYKYNNPSDYRHPRERSIKLY